MGTWQACPNRRSHGEEEGVQEATPEASNAGHYESEAVLPVLRTVIVGGVMPERPPVDPPRRPNRPDPEGKVRILCERGSWSNSNVTCFWHDGCQKMHSAPMKIVSTEDDYTVLECTVCGVRGRYPVGGNALVICDKDSQEKGPSK